MGRTRSEVKCKLHSVSSLKTSSISISSVWESDILDRLLGLSVILLLLGILEM